MDNYCIYCLLDKNDSPFYIGMSMQVDIRVAVHKLSFGKDISLKIIERITGTKKDAAIAEKKWIKTYISEGYSLVNRQHIEDCELVSVRIHKDVVKKIKIHVATYGGTIRSVLEHGAKFAMEENIRKSQKEKELRF